METRSKEIQLTSEEVDYILKLHNAWREDLLDGPLISFSAWILGHEISGSEERDEPEKN